VARWVLSVALLAGYAPARQVLRPHLAAARAALSFVNETESRTL
jgi:hypothetical protein